MDVSSLNELPNNEVDSSNVNKQNEVNVNTSEEEQHNTSGKHEHGGESRASKVFKQGEKHKAIPSPQTDKRTSKRRLLHTNRSIIQNAIAIKEKSFEDYLKPRTKPIKPTKIKSIYEDVVDKELPNSTPNVNSKKTLQKLNQTSNKKLKCSQSDSKSSDIECEPFYENLDEAEPHLRRSQRTLSGDNKRRSSLVDDKSEKEELLLEQLNFRSCKCTENKGLFMESKTDSHFCTAVDSISDKLIGCTRLVDIKTVPMHRPSTRIPFGVFCEAHLQRLIRHNCCPMCGVFCTQGEFVECTSKHYFHKDCQFSVGDIPCCPHCGDSTPYSDVVISMYSSKEPIFLPIQRSHHTSAEISFETNTTDIEHSSTDEECDFPALLSLEELVDDDAVSNDCNEFSLIEAIENENIARVAAILGSGSINLQSKLEDYNDGTFLHLAATNGNVQIIHLLVSSTIDIDQFDKDQNTALMLGTIGHKNEIVKYLIKSGADIALKGPDGMTVLHLAAKYGNLHACQTIMTATIGVPNFVNFQDDGGWTPLAWACEHGHTDVVKYLVSDGADVNIRDVEHNTPLHWAAFGGHCQIVEFLLNWKCDINAVNIHKESALHLSARENRYNCVMLLLARKADITLLNSNDETPLDCAPKGGKCFNLLALNNQICSTISSEYTNNRKGLLTNDISKGREINPIQCYNDIDTSEEPKGYKYIRNNCISSDEIRINMSVATIQSCSCQDRCTFPACSCGKLSQKCWYGEEGELLPEFNLNDPPLIFECNDMCSCNAILCINRVVQKPSKNRFQIFKTALKGWTVKTLNFLPKGKYVCEYVGEILTDVEAELRDDDSYLFDLDNRDTDSFCIDAKYYGNFARFINHSCDPNLHPLKVFVEHHDLRFPHVAFFAKRNILSDEELSFDYGEKFWLVKYKSFTCACGTALCRYSKDSIKNTLEKYQLAT